MKKDIYDLTKKAKDSLKGAKVLLREHLYDFSVSRSYYAMFYATEAVLLIKNLAFSKHKGVISAFGKEFVKSGVFPEQMHTYLTEAFKYRQKGDYGPVGAIDTDDAKKLIEQAEEFIDEIEEYLKKEGYQTQ